MKKTRYRLKTSVKIVMYTFFLVCLFLITAYFFIKTYKSRIVEKVNYTDNSNIDYKVYLKENNFFDMPYLEKNSTYISSLIKYIDVAFDYRMDYSASVTGKFSYYVQATLLANKPNDQEKNYWSKAYRITEPKEFDVTNQNYFNINANVKIDYQQYNDLLTGFKKEYNLPIDGILKIELVVESSVNNEKITKDITNKSSTFMEMPLTQASVDIEIKTSNVNSEMKEVMESNYKASNRYKIIAYICSIVTIVELIFFVKFLTSVNKKKNFYATELKKILSTYDGIIVNVERLQDLSKYNIIRVKTFNELIDAHSEVRMPINYIEAVKNEESVFILINDNIAWVYRLSNK